MKVPRSKEEPGKGGFWRLDPAFAESLDNGEKPYRLRKRRNPPKNKNKNKDSNKTNNAAPGSIQGVNVSSPEASISSPIDSMCQPIQIQHACDDLSCSENQNHMVAQEMEIHLRIPNQSQQTQQNFINPLSPSSGSVPNIIQHIQTHSPIEYSPPEGITVLQNVQMLDPSPESANILQSGNFLELTSAERIYNSNGECVYVFCTSEQNLSALTANNNNNNQTPINIINNINGTHQYLGDSISFPINIENTIEIPMEGGLGSEISSNCLKLNLDRQENRQQLNKIMDNFQTVTNNMSHHHELPRYHDISIHQVGQNGELDMKPSLTNLSNHTEVIEISTLAADIEKESNQYSIQLSGQQGFGLSQELSTIAWDDRLTVPSINFLETELDLEELIRCGEL